MSDNIPRPPAPLSPEQIIAWLDYEYEVMLQRRDDKILPVLQSIAATYASGIEDDETQGNCAENVRMAKALLALAESHRKEAKDPFLNGGRAVDGWFGGFADPIKVALRPVEQIMLDYAERKLAEQRAAREAERRKADEAAARAAQEAAQAVRDHRPSVETREKLDASEDAQEAARRAAAQAEAKPSEQTRVRGVYGATASVRTQWRWEVSDFSLIPREYLMVNPDAIKVAAKPRDHAGRPSITIPGITWVEEHRMGVR